MTSKKYVAYVAAILYTFMILNLALWHGITKDIFMGRDLQRMGSITTTAPLTEDRHYPKRHEELAEWIASGKLESCDVLTIGDSFSNGRDGSSYQDYLVNEYGLRVLNARSNYHALRDLYILLNSGIIDAIKARVVILESVQRFMQGRLGEKLLLCEDESSRYSAHPANNADSVAEGFMPPIMSQANTDFLYNKIFHMMSPGQLSPEVYITKLDRKLFTNPGYEDTLLFINGDLNYLRAPLNAEMVNKNLNNAARLLKAKGITLIFFAAVDKYDLYYPYITDKSGRPENPFFQKLRDVQGKEYIYIDTITPLRQALERGEQDIYWLTDTHWSHKGIKIVCDELVKYILPELPQIR